MRRATLLGLLAALALPAPAFAHASLEHTSPGFRQRLERSPVQVRLEFDQGVKAFPSSIQVLDANGKLFSGVARSVGRKSTRFTAANVNHFCLEYLIWLLRAS